MRQPTALDRSTATDRGYSENTSASYIEKLLGKDGMQSALFPPEEIEREKLVAAIMKKSAEAAETDRWIRATEGVRKI